MFSINSPSYEIVNEPEDDTDVIDSNLGYKELGWLKIILYNCLCLCSTSNITVQSSFIKIVKLEVHQKKFKKKLTMNQS